MGEKLSRYHIRVDDDFGTLFVCWQRHIHAESESLITSYGKHRFFELHYLLDGSIDFHTADRDFTVNAGEFVLVAPGHYHSITAYSPNARKMVFAFDVRLADASLASSFSKIGVRHETETAQMRSMAELLALLPSDAALATGVQIRCITEAFFLELMKAVLPDVSCGALTRMKADNRSMLVERMYDFVRSRLGGNFPSVEELAEYFNISRRHLSRITVETVGKTPREILDEERLIYIRELLATTDYTMQEIAFLCGFSSENSLARFFRLKENTTLNKYKKDTML